MTDFNTSMMREVFKWLSKYEEPPAEYDEKWWAGMTTEAAEIYNRYQTVLTRQILYGIIDAHSEQHRYNMINQMEKRNAAGAQIAFDTTYGGMNHGNA